MCMLFLAAKDGFRIAENVIHVTECFSSLLGNYRRYIEL